MWRFTWMCLGLPILVRKQVLRQLDTKKKTMMSIQNGNSQMDTWRFTWCCLHLWGLGYLTTSFWSKWLPLSVSGLCRTLHPCMGIPSRARHQVELPFSEDQTLGTYARPPPAPYSFETWKPRPCSWMNQVHTKWFEYCYFPEWTNQIPTQVEELIWIISDRWNHNKPCSTQELTGVVPPSYPDPMPSLPQLLSSDALPLEGPRGHRNLRQEQVRRASSWANELCSKDPVWRRGAKHSRSLVYLWQSCNSIWHHSNNHMLLIVSRMKNTHNIN